MGCAGVPESMWSVAGSDHTKLAHALLDHRSKTSVRKSTVRVFQGKEDFTFSALRTNLAEIAQNRLTDLLHEWIALALALLRTTHIDGLLLPVNILQMEETDFAAAKAVNNEKRQDCMVTNVRS